MKQLLSIAEHMRIAYAFRLGYPIHKAAKYPRVRRGVEGIVRHNRYEARGRG